MPIDVSWPTAKSSCASVHTLFASGGPPVEASRSHMHANGEKQNEGAQEKREKREKREIENDRE